MITFDPLEGFDDISPARIAEHAAREWSALYRPTCSCQPLEVRAEKGGLECAFCGRPIVARRAP